MFCGYRGSIYTLPRTSILWDMIRVRLCLFNNVKKFLIVPNFMYYSGFTFGGVRQTAERQTSYIIQRNRRSKSLWYHYRLSNPSRFFPMDRVLSLQSFECGPTKRQLKEKKSTETIRIQCKLKMGQRWDRYACSHCICWFKGCKQDGFHWGGLQTHIWTWLSFEDMYLIMDRNTNLIVNSCWYWTIR